MPKYYFAAWSPDQCQTEEDHRHHMEFHGMETMEVTEAKVEYGTGMFFCKAFNEVTESRVSCGFGCEKYDPRNGISGICWHHGNVFEDTGVKKTLIRVSK